ncbi:MAG: 3-oxoacyl-[acyl-carrier-protein] synthase 2 [Pseudomonadota bacterium]
MQHDVAELTVSKSGLRRVAITGIGVISPVGNDPKQCFEQLLSGTSVVGALPGEASAERGLNVGAVVKDFDAAAVVGKKNIKRTSRFLQMGLACARSARADAALETAKYETARIGCLFGSSLAGLDMVMDTACGFSDSGMPGVSPFLLPGSLNNMAAGMIAIDANVHGPCYAVSAGWSSSMQAIGHAFEMVRRGSADAMLAGGSESLTGAPLAAALLGRTGLFVTESDTPAQASRPFDAARSGLLAGEGAAMLVLEGLDEAIARGAAPYAEIMGYASTFAPTANRARTGWYETMVDCMRNALESAGIDPTEVEYINAYGSSSQATDAMEAKAIKEVFNGHSSKLWISSSKGVTGHMLGASGAFETAMTSMALKRGIVPPTANMRTPDSGCDLDFMPGAARERRIVIAMKNSFAESGHCGSLILRIVA